MEELKEIMWCVANLRDRRMSVKLKGNINKTVVRPALLYGAVTYTIQYNTIQYNKLYFTSDTDHCIH